MSGQTLGVGFRRGELHRPSPLTPIIRRPLPAVTGTGARTRLQSITAAEVQENDRERDDDEAFSSVSLDTPVLSSASGGSRDSWAGTATPTQSQPATPSSPLAQSPSFHAPFNKSLVLTPAGLRIRMSVVDTDEEDPTPTELAYNGSPYSQVSYPGTPFNLGKESNASEETVTLHNRGSNQNHAAGNDDISIVCSFFADDSEQPLLSAGVQGQFPRSLDVSRLVVPPSTPIGAGAPSFKTLRSFATVISGGVLSLSLDELCDFIAEHKSLQRGHIVSTECYTEKIGVVVHRFVVMELRREGRKDIWLRLDRQRQKNVSTLDFLIASGSCLSNDTAQLAPQKGKLIGAGAHRENRQIFSRSPTLSQLEHLLRVICEEITTYNVWPENCWFFCSLLQQHLGSTLASDGHFVEGALRHAHLAPDARNRVNKRLGLTNTPSPQSPNQRPVPPRKDTASSRASTGTSIAPSTIMLSKERPAFAFEAASNSKTGNSATPRPHNRHRTFSQKLLSLLRKWGLVCC